jgi:beta-carotene 3-hydroxylase
VIRLLVSAAALVVMEPVVAAVHRWVMHGRGWVWHRSHHRWQGRRIEANDLYPVAFAAATIATMAVGAAIEGLAALLWVGVGVTGYGIAYLVVHDLLIHGRLGRLPGTRSRYVRWVTAAHALHHRYGREPYGFLLPRVTVRSRLSTCPTAPHASSDRAPAAWDGGPAHARPAWRDGLTVPVEVDSEDLLAAPMGEPQPTVVPAG